MSSSLSLSKELVINEPNHKKIDKKTAGKNPATAKPLTKLATNITNNPLITKEKSPSVKILIGKVSKNKTGLIKALIKPKTIAVIKAAYRLLTLTPLIT